MATGLSFSLANKGSAVSTADPSRADKDKTTSKHGNKRSHASLDDDSDGERQPAKQLVTHFGTKGAINAHAPEREKAPLIIKPQANRDWREAAENKKRAKYGLPVGSKQEVEKAQEDAIRKIEDSKKPTWGLNVKKAKAVEDDTSDENSTGAETGGENGTEQVQKPKTDDEKAMDALLGVKHQSERIISAVSEEEAFQQDFKTAPPQATLDQYTAMPVEEFGAALLRGMGWKEGHGIGSEAGSKVKKAKAIQRRPALLGIGAKEDAAVKEEIGAWGRGAKKKADIVYNPIVMRNKRTGEEVTEQEMKERLEEQSIKDREADIAAIAAARKSKSSNGERRKDEARHHSGHGSDEDYNRRKKERRRERDWEEKDTDRRDRRRSRERDERRNRGSDDRRDRDRDHERRERDRRRDRDERDRDYKRDDRRHKSSRNGDDDERRRRH